MLNLPCHITWAMVVIVFFSPCAFTKSHGFPTDVTFPLLGLLKEVVLSAELVDAICNANEKNISSLL